MSITSATPGSNRPDPVLTRILHDRSKLDTSRPYSVRLDEEFAVVRDPKRWLTYDEKSPVPGWVNVAGMTGVVGGLVGGALLSLTGLDFLFGSGGTGGAVAAGIGAAALMGGLWAMVHQAYDKREAQHNTGAFHGRTIDAGVPEQLAALTIQDRMAFDRGFGIDETRSASRVTDEVYRQLGASNDGVAVDSTKQVVVGEHRGTLTNALRRADSDSNGFVSHDELKRTIDAASGQDVEEVGGSAGGVRAVGYVNDLELLGLLDQDT